jgi:hypothetical protein
MKSRKINRERIMKNELNIKFYFLRARQLPHPLSTLTIYEPPEMLKQP